MVKEGTTDGAWHGHGRDEVTITAVSTVAPALPVQEHRLPLSNLDLILPPIDVSVFFCYVDPAGGRSHHPAAVLKAALAKTLVAYYPLAGEVVANAAGEPELLCSGRGVDVAEATADGTLLRDLRLGLPDESVEPLVPKKKAGVMSVQVTRFKCGGTVVGCTFDHRVCDAYSYNMFLVAWAAAARGSSAPPAPSFHRSFLAPREPAPLSCTAGNRADRLFVPVSRAPALPDTAAANRIYRVSAADVAALQASAGSGRTKLEAFTAHLWRLYAKAAAASRRQQQSCCMGVVVDGRTRLRRDGALSAYFGNVLTIPYGVMGTGALSTMALADVAGDVHRWVAEAATGEHFRELVNWVEAQRPEPTVARAYLGRGHGGEDAMACVVSSGMRLPVGEVDFGWGPPAFASYHFPWPGGAGYVMPMPSARGDGDWVVYVHAAPEVVEVMEAEPTVFRALDGSYIFG
ncbi:coniferyl alcohol acyltransferase-like isoform X1 [Miscanthus floridulus]|uniref:coniferyl alcohol acyltransferase-like isoform X1 n=1 Tax=Miscanthus floridulus TaxID=154761 RepID=UPI00345917FE